MEARATFRGPRASRTFVAGVLVMVALGVGATGGYVAAGLAGARVAPPSQGAPRAITDSQGGPQSDLTRAQPTAAPAQGGPQSDLTRALPSAAPAAAPRSHQDGPNFTE
jgi:hypothetical protein